MKQIEEIRGSPHHITFCWYEDQKPSINDDMTWRWFFTVQLVILIWACDTSWITDICWYGIIWWLRGDGREAENQDAVNEKFIMCSSTLSTLHHILITTEIILMLITPTLVVDCWTLPLIFYAWEGSRDSWSFLMVIIIYSCSLLFQ